MKLSIPVTYTVVGVPPKARKPRYYYINTVVEMNLPTVSDLQKEGKLAFTVGDCNYFVLGDDLFSASNRDKAGLEGMLAVKRGNSWTEKLDEEPVLRERVSDDLSPTQKELEGYLSNYLYNEQDGIIYKKSCEPVYRVLSFGLNDSYSFEVFYGYDRYSDLDILQHSGKVFPANQKDEAFAYYKERALNAYRDKPSQEDLKEQYKKVDIQVHDQTAVTCTKRNEDDYIGLLGVELHINERQATAYLDFLKEINSDIEEAHNIVSQFPSYLGEVLRKAAKKHAKNS